ncbi:Protein Hook-like protein [Smittium culicis]|uniref:Protein Hook-like protein n=1 Tax=Smittium culicis TaxID=133412 RepID=A0A1R1WZ61_9FUNG|nr:Protein Hook-like protein [Smittium culicis]
MDINFPSDPEIGFIQWVNTFKNLSKNVTSISDLSDGIVLFEICSDIDPQWFRIIRSTDVGDNWVFKYNNLKKLYRLLLAYCEEILLFPSTNIPDPDLDSIAKENSSMELIKVTSLVLTVAVNCEKKNDYISGIMTLSEENQGLLMVAIEKTMTLLDSPVAETSKYGPSSPNDQNAKSSYPDINSPNQNDMNSVLQAELLAQIEKNNSLKDNLEKLASEADSWRKKFQEEKHNRIELSNQLEEYIGSQQNPDASNIQNNKPDLLLKAELDALRSDLDKSETQRNELSVQLQEAILKSNKMNSEILNQKNLLSELNRLKDQEQEHLHVLEKLSKNENIIEKYRQKLEQSSDYKKKLLLTENMLKKETAAKSELEAKYISLVSNREGSSSNNPNSVDSLSKLESQLNLATIHISELEKKISAIELEKQKLVKSAEDAKHYAQDIEEKYRDLELTSGIHSNFLEDHSSPRNSIAKNSLGDVFGENPVQLLEEISKLKQELEQSKKENLQHKKNSEQEHLESWIEDANKEKQEADNKVSELQKLVDSLNNQIATLKQESQQKIKNLELELSSSSSELAETKSKLNEANEKTNSLFSELNGSIRQIESLETQLSESTEKLSEAQSALTQLQEYKEKQSKAAKEFKLAQNDNENLASWYSDLQAQLDEKDKIIKQLSGSNTNVLEINKDLLELKEKLQLSRQESHNNSLHLQKAKADLNSELERLKNSSSPTSRDLGSGKMGGNSSEPHLKDQLNLLKSQIESKQEQIAHLQQKNKEIVEQKGFEGRLISSAWFYVTRKLEKNSGFGMSAVEKSMGQASGYASGGPSGQRGSIAYQNQQTVSGAGNRSNDVNSWLETQRNALDKQIYNKR